MFDRKGGEFGKDLVIRGDLRHEITARGSLILLFPTMCRAGHLLKAVGSSQDFNHFLGLPALRCSRCIITHPDLAEWALIDPEYDCTTADKADGLGIDLVLHPPVDRLGIGSINISLDRTPCGEIQFQMCGACHVGVIHNLEVIEERRHRGYGRVLVQAALARRHSYQWSTMDPQDSQEFWSRIGWGLAGRPRPCTHMAA